jgi:HK97 gp10 family phage protein
MLRIMVEVHSKPLSQIAEQLRDAEETLLVASSSEAASRSRSIAPARTGRLRSSIGSTRLGRLEWALEAKAPYAAYVEYGTRRMVARPYMRPGAASVLPLAAAGCGRLVEEALRSV